MATSETSRDTCNGHWPLPSAEVHVGPHWSTAITTIGIIIACLPHLPWPVDVSDRQWGRREGKCDRQVASNVACFKGQWQINVPHAIGRMRHATIFCFSF